MRKKKKTGWTFAAVVITGIHIIPIIITLIASLSKYGEKKSLWVLPEKWQFQNYIDAFINGNLGVAFKNTLIITVISVVVLLIIGGMASYPLARSQSRLNDGIINGILAIMMIPSLSLLVPLYKFMICLQGANTYWGIILIHVTFQLPMCMFLFRNFIKAIPRELDEAALIDGCNSFRIFYSIILPLLKPVVATVVILAGVGIWNDYANSLYFLQKPEMKTLTLSVSSFFSQTNQNLNVAAAAALTSILPITVIYIILQKQFVKGAVDSAIK